MPRHHRCAAGRRAAPARRAPDYGHRATASRSRWSLLCGPLHGNPGDPDRPHVRAELGAAAPPGVFVVPIRSASPVGRPSPPPSSRSPARWPPSRVRQRCLADPERGPRRGGAEGIPSNPASPPRCARGATGSCSLAAMTENAGCRDVQRDQGGGIRRARAGPLEAAATFTKIVAGADRTWPWASRALGLSSGLVEPAGDDSFCRHRAALESRGVDCAGD